MSTTYLEVQGMSCGGCVKRVTDALKPLNGVSHVDVDLAAGQVSVDGDFPQGTDQLISALAAAGYKAKLSTPITSIPSVKKSGGCCG